MQNEQKTLPAIEDEPLVERALAGDHPAFAELIRRHRPDVYRTALGILRDPHNAEDEVQNACWKAFEHLNQFRQDSKFSTWLTRIAINQCLMRLRQDRRAQLIHLDEPLPGSASPALEVRDNSDTPEMGLGRAEVAALLEREVNRIPPILRRVFLLREMRMLPMPDVARELGISVAAAKSRLLRARTELRHRLMSHTGRLGPATLCA